MSPDEETPLEPSEDASVPSEAAETPPAPESPRPESEAPPQDETTRGDSAADESPESAGEPTSVEQPEQPEAAEPAAEAPPSDEEMEEYEPEARVRPEVPGADLIPDVLPEAEEFLDAEARAAAEAEAEARAAREREETTEAEAKPLTDVAIDLAAGARYTATGKRKSAVARVILKPGDGTYAINGKPLDDYFPRETLRRVIRQPLEMVGYEARMDVVARMHGGGVAAQAQALRHGISRALLVADPHLRSELKRRGFLTRDPRVKERKKAGLKKARKRPQFSKR